MLQQTNLVIISQAGLYSANPTGVPVDVCDQCGGLFVRPGQMFFGLPHTH